MATRSTIAIEYADGTVGQVYCHWDGYLAYNGKLLQEHYTDPFKLRDLIDLGDLSSLQSEIGVEHPFSYHGSDISKEDYEKKFSGMCTFYGRDRGETGTEAKKFVDFQDYLAHHQYEEYEYILRQVNGQAVWYVKCHDEPYKTLEQALIEEQVAEEN
jgi:hypothetical protein